MQIRFMLLTLLICSAIRLKPDGFANDRATPLGTGSRLFVETTGLVQHRNRVVAGPARFRATLGPPSRFRIHCPTMGVRRHGNAPGAEEPTQPEASRQCRSTLSGFAGR